VGSIWKHALELREMLGEDNIRLLRQDQMRRSMWDFLSESLMTTLKDSYSNTNDNKNKYASLIRGVEKSLISNEIVGHEAA